MPSKTFAEVPTPRPDWAAQFFRDWFDDERELFNVIMMIDPTKPAAHRDRLDTLHQSPAVWRETFEEHSLDALIYAKDTVWNLYMGVGLNSHQLPRGKKGGKRDVARVPGIYADLDVNKDGCFRDEDHALSLLRSVRPYASTVVPTGTGGVHAYWKVTGGLSPQEAEDLTSMWWAHLTAVSETKIDKLTNCDRVMKLPGSIRWEKDPGDQPTLVRLLYSSTDTVSAGELARVAQPAWDDYRKRVEERRRDVKRQRAETMRLAGGGMTATGRWGSLLSAVALEDEFNETHSWHEVLEPLGWTDIGSDSEGRTLWARPGQDRGTTYKSAATGYGDSHVMSLFSDSPATGLWPLAEAGVPLTKYRVWIQTRFAGDEVAYARAALGLDGG